MPQANTTRDTVAAMTAQGYTARQIARELDLSTQAVYYHLERLQANDTARSGPETNRRST